MSRREAMDALYREWARPLWGRFYAVCCDAELARDAVQEAFLRLHREPQVRDPAAWLYRVGRNWLLDEVRRRPTVGLEDAGPLAALAGPEPERREQAELVRAALGELSEEDREVVALRYALGWPSRRIAEAVGSTADAVDRRLSRARERLAGHLANLGVRHESLA